MTVSSLGNVGAKTVDKGAVEGIVGIPERVDVSCRLGIKISQGKLNDGRGVNDPAISLTHAASTGSHRLLTNREVVTTCAGTPG